MDGDVLAQGFEEHRPRLRAVARRMLGSTSEADDALQEAWLRIDRAGAEGVENLGGWLTTVVARICLDALRARRARPEDPAGTRPPEAAPAGRDPAGPEDDALVADSVGVALLVVLDTLSPAERLAFVLHDLFDVPFAEIAPIVDRSPAATRQLASRARRRVLGTGPTPGRRRARQREIVAAFLAAAHDGDFETLIALLDPDAVLRADPAAVRMGVAAEIVGADGVARRFSGALGARLALVDGAAGAVWAPRGRPRVVFAFTTSGGRITAIEQLAEADRLARLDVEILGA